MINSISEVQRLTSPNPFCLITSCDRHGMTNLMAVSWWTYVSFDPATVAISVNSKAYTSVLINESKEFGLCVVDQSLNPAAFECGTFSGKDKNKAETLGIELIDAEKISPKIVKAHRVALECKVINTIPVHENSLFLGEVCHIHTNPDTKHLYALDGYQRLGVINQTT